MARIIRHSRVDSSWQKHPEKYDYTVKRFTDDWTTESSVGVIKSHKVDISKTHGTGTFGTEFLWRFGERGPQDFMWYEKKDGTLTYPAPHELEYN